MVKRSMSKGRYYVMPASVPGGDRALPLNFRSVREILSLQELISFLMLQHRKKITGGEIM